MVDIAVSRRGVIGGAAAIAAVASTGIVEVAHAQAHKTFVLVHGTFCGSWTWRRVADLLEQKGHKVFTPTLSGLGERSHVLSKAIDMDIHIADVANVIKWESLENVCLVAHSYGGWVASGSLEQIGEHVSSIIWIDAYKPADGQKVIDFTGFRTVVENSIAKGEAGFAPPPNTPAIFVSAKDALFVDAKLTPHPVTTYMQPIKLTGARDKVAKKTYVRIPRFPNPVFDNALAECEADKSWTTEAFTDSGHMAMLDAPERLTDLILKSA